MRNDGLSCRLASRLYEKTTSCAVIGSPFEKRTPFRRWKKKKRAFLLIVQLVASAGTGLLVLLPA